MTGPVVTRWVVDLEDPASADVALVGGKAAQLHVLCRAGLPVPEALVITTEAFHRHFAAAVEPPTAAPALQPALSEALQAALEDRFEPAVVLAVRSSAVDEDANAASFAGQHATYYYVSIDQIGPAVQNCWMSLWSAEAIAYRSRRGPDTAAAPAMAVVVQRMLRAESSGVCFTADPTGRFADQGWIEATWGLGAALVDGRVSPDRLRLNRAGDVLAYHTARKQLQVAAEPISGDGLRLEPVPALQQSQPVLTAAQAAEVWRLSLAAERLGTGSQDVEWAYQDGRLYLLQSRPITGAPPAEQVAGSWVLFKPLAENFTEPLSPMAADLFQRVLPPVGRFIDGRYYVDLDAAARLCPFRWSRHELADAMLLRTLPAPRLAPGRALLFALAMASGFLLDGANWHRSAFVTRHGLRAYGRLCQRLRGATDVPLPVLLHRLVLGRHPGEPIGQLAYYVNVMSGRYFLVLGVLRSLVARWAPEFDPQRVSQLCCGDGGTFSRQLVECVNELAAVARHDRPLAARIATAPAAELAQTLAELPASHPFAQAMAGFLTDFGHRCAREMELAMPRWREDPVPVLLMVRGYLGAEPARAGAGEALFVEARAALRQALKRRWQVAVVELLVRRLRYYTSLREDTRHYHAMAMEVVRTRLVELEQQLLRERRLRLPGDVFYLTWAEARDLARGHLGWRDVADAIRRRRRDARRLARETPREVVGESVSDLPPPGDATVPAIDQRRLHGRCASAGSASGRVRVVLDPTSAHGFEPGDVLVAPYTDPAWTPLFPLAAAVVVEIGSFLSHAGTVAREYGIPCLVDVTGCTTLLRDGERVRVLAGEGRLEILP